MKLRELRQSDASRMLEWMHDISIVEKLHTDFMSKTIDDCRKFIVESNNIDNLNLAITDDNNVYMGTVSLKHITDINAEFAIVICKDAMGKGYAIEAMKEILEIGFRDYSLEYIYWCVAKDNIRAVRFYEKNNFERFRPTKNIIVGEYTDDEISKYIWYCCENPNKKRKN